MRRGAPTTSTSTAIIAQSVNLATTTPPPSTPSSPICPAANGSTYIATNKPTATQASDPHHEWQISNTILFFEILCDTHFMQQGNDSELVDEVGIMDLQVYSNISSLNDCLDICALYNFHIDDRDFPAQGCTGVAFGSGAFKQGQEGLYRWHTCWLQSNVSLGSPNHNAEYPGYDGAVLLGN